MRDGLAPFGASIAHIAGNTDFLARAWVAGPGPPPPPTEMRAADYVESVNRASFRIDPPRRSREGLLVASLVQDGGWRARDDRGRRLETMLANGPFLAIRIPPGASSVSLSYAPPGFRIGALISAATLLALVALGSTLQTAHWRSQP